MPFSPKTRVASPRLVVGVAALLNLTSYVDRSCISVAAPQIGRELHLTPIQLGSVFSSFFLLYALLQAPWGMLADRLGPRRIVAIAVFGWCTFTALTGAAMNYLALLAVRFAFGGMEPALGPAISSAFAACVPEKSRAGAFGVFLAGGRIGGALAPVIAAFLVMRHGWRAAFIVLALAGLAVPFLWLRAVPSEPSSPNGRPGARTAITSQLSLRFGALLLVVFGYTIMWQFFATWYPTYLVERRGFTLAVAAKYASVPFILGIVSNWIGGWMCDALSRRFGVVLGRGFFGSMSLASSAALVYAGLARSDNAAPWLFAASAGAGDLFLPLAWSAAAELGGPSAGAFAGLMNSASNLGAFVAPLVIGVAIQRWRNWDATLLMGMAATSAAALLWIPVYWPIRRDPAADSCVAS